MKKFSILIKENLCETSVIYDVKSSQKKTEFTFSPMDNGWNKHILNKNQLSLTDTGNGIEIKTFSEETFLIDYAAFELLAVYFKYFSNELNDHQVFSIDKLKQLKEIK